MSRKQPDPDGIIPVNVNGNLMSSLEEYGIEIPEGLVSDNSRKFKFSGMFKPINPSGTVVLENPGSVRAFLAQKKEHEPALEPIETAEEFLALIASAKKNRKKLPQTIVVRSIDRKKTLCFVEGKIRVLGTHTLHAGASIAAKVATTRKKAAAKRVVAA